MVPAVEKGSVDVAELTEEDLDCPGIEGDVMRLEKHDVVVRGEAEEDCPQHEIAAQVEWAARVLPQEPVEGVGAVHDIDDWDVDLPLLEHDLFRRAVIDSEDRAQRPGTLDEHLERSY